MSPPVCGSVNAFPLGVSASFPYESVLRSAFDTEGSSNGFCAGPNQRELLRNPKYAPSPFAGADPRKGSLYMRTVSSASPAVHFRDSHILVDDKLSLRFLQSNNFLTPADHHAVARTRWRSTTAV